MPTPKAHKGHKWIFTGADQSQLLPDTPLVVNLKAVPLIHSPFPWNTSQGGFFTFSEAVTKNACNCPTAPAAKKMFHNFKPIA